MNKCQNIMCGRDVEYDYCDNECRDFQQLWRNKIKTTLKRRGIYTEVKTHYPHRLYPNTILVIPN